MFKYKQSSIFYFDYNLTHLLLALQQKNKLNLKRINIINLKPYEFKFFNCFPLYKKNIISKLKNKIKTKANIILRHYLSLRLPKLIILNFEKC